MIRKFILSVVSVELALIAVLIVPFFAPTLHVRLGKVFFDKEIQAFFINAGIFIVSIVFFYKILNGTYFWWKRKSLVQELTRDNEKWKAKFKKG
jgi:hypothetical protein